jgi:predicted NBD/HSP70 family sugar kinase
MVPFKEILEKEFGIPVYIENDVNSYALAELLYGVAKTLDNFVCVTFGSGVGAGIIINRQLYRGDFGGAGEVGHYVFIIDGEPCRCGQSGCFENYTSDRFILNKTKELLDKSGDRNSSLYQNKDSLSIEAILKAAQEDDEYACEAYREVGKNIGIGLANIINIFNPVAIILTGEGIKAREFIEEGIINYSKRNFFMNHQCCPVIFSKFGEDGWEIGAVTAAIIELFEAPIYKSARSLVW